MRTLIHLLLPAVLVAGFLSPLTLQAQSPPADFQFSATSGGIAPWSEMVRITIDSAGNANYVRSKTGGPPTILAEGTFTIDAPGLQQLWSTLQGSGFFSLDPTYIDSTVGDGMFARISVTANGATKQVKITNIAQPAIQGILDSLNSVVPDSFRIPFTPPHQFDYTPQAPCLSFPGALGNPKVDARIQNSRDLKIQMFPGPYPRRISRVSALDVSHPGTVVAYNMTLQDAIALGWANLTSKGNYFGDAVSVTVNNKNHPPPSNTVSITLFLEFWGPLATQANIDAIEKDIAAKWDGVTNSAGQKVQVGFVDRANTYATSPPNTPGFNEIDLVPLDSYRSDAIGKVNSGTGSGTWEVGLPPGTYGHEAGHLMGLPDRYDDYNKQPDGSWANSRTGQSYPDDGAFANYLITKVPGYDVNEMKDFLKKTDTYSVPRNGSENDLMADPSKKPIQSDIDQITAHPGMLVSIPAATPLVNRANGEQDLVVTHSDYVYAGPGEQRTLNGVYTACIDEDLEIPSTGGVFDVAPPLNQWTGIRAAGYMANLLHYVDSAGLFCDLDLVTQEAIWRISDNLIISFNSEVDSLFSAAGVNIGSQIMDFPRMDRNGATDTLSHPYIPDQLYVADIEPPFSSGQVGNASTLSVQISHPPGSPAPVGISWNATGLDGAGVAITGADSSASLTPAKSGIYQVGVNVSFNDSLHGQKTFSSDHKAYIIVPDSYTETFEHPGLTDKYPWGSYGNVPWTITSNFAETGTYSAQSGLVANGQYSTLGVDVSLSKDDTIAFSLRVLTRLLVDLVVFSIDSLEVDQFTGISDWTPYTESVPAGKHRLSWTYENNSSTAMNNAWLDNIFFPGNVVVTSLNEAVTKIPTVFALEQNYPNPFNPTTTIGYDLPKATHVSLTVFSALGQKVATLVDTEQPAGRYRVQFDGRSLASGAYFCRMQAGTFVDTKQILLIK